MNYYNQQPNQQLPFDPQNFMWPMLNINVNYPPFVPNIQTLPDLQGYLPIISGMAMQEVQQTARNNALRVFAFNRYAQNSFNNAEFSGLVSAIVDYVILLTHFWRSVPDYTAAVHKAVPEATSMYTASEIYYYPQLEAYLDPQTLNEVRTTFQDFQRVGNEIQSLKRSGQWPVGQYQQQPQQGFPQYNPNQYSAPAYRQGPATQQTGGAAPSIVGNGSRSAPASSSSLGVNSVSASRWDNKASEVLQQPFESRSAAVNNEPVVVDQIMATPAEPAPLLELPVTQLSHHPKLEDGRLWYLPAFDPAQYELTLVQLPDGSTSPKINPRPNVQDYDKHRLPNAFGPVPVNLELHSGEALRRLEEGIKELNGEKPEHADDNPAYQPSVFVKTDIAIVTSENEAWLTSMLERLAKTDAKPEPDIFRMYFQIAEPIIGMHNEDEDEDEAVQSLARSVSFIALRETLNAQVNSMSPALWEAVNNRLTRTINRLLRQNLSVPKLSIDSFSEDIVDLLEHLEDTYGDVVRNALTKHQRRIIEQTFITPEPDAARQITEALLDGRDYGDNKPNITYLASDVSLTLLNCRVWDLGIDLVPDVASVLTRKYAPVLYELVVNLFHETKDVANFARHLIRTNDNRVLEASRGFIPQGGEEAYLLTLIE